MKKKYRLRKCLKVGALNPLMDSSRIHQITSAYSLYEKPILTL